MLGFLFCIYPKTKHLSIEEQKVRFRETLEAYAGFRFQTDDGLRFDYTLKGNHLHLSEDEAYSEGELLEIVELKRTNMDKRLEVVFKRIGAIK